MENKHYNPSFGEDLRRIFNPKGGEQASSYETKIQPIVLLPTRVDIARSAGSATTGATTIYTTPADKDFYLTSVQISGAADATADNVEYTIECVTDGVARSLIGLRKITTTAFTGQSSIAYLYPLKIDRNSIISVNTAFTVGAASKRGAITGYTLEVAKGVY